MNDQEESTEEFEVVELESEDGDSEEFVVFERYLIGNSKYVVMALLEDVEAVDASLTEDQVPELDEDENIFIIMKEDGDNFLELSEEELAVVEEKFSQTVKEHF